MCAEIVKICYNICYMVFRFDLEFEKTSLNSNKGCHNMIKGKLH